MIHIVRCSVLVCVATLAHAQDPRLERSVRNVYGNVLIAKAAQQRYDAKQPASAAANDSAVRAWLASAGIPAIERVGREQFPSAMTGAEADMRRFQSVVNLTLKMAESKYATLAEFLSATMPWTKYEDDLARLRPMMGATLASSDGGSTSVATAAPTLAPMAPSVAATVGVGDLEGVYLRRVTTTGYGGMIIFAFEPFLHYADGSVFVEPVSAIESIDRSRSRSSAPHAWGEVVSKSGATWRVRMAAVQRPRDKLDREFVGVYRLTPARSGQALDGDFRSIGGTGSLATGGSAAVVVEESWSFRPDGRFARGGFAGASTGGVTTGSTRAAQVGRYRVDGYGIELVYDAGKTERLLFGLDQSGGLVTVGGSVYSRRRK
jgi:hypothetical protein